jgi:hypothetical protein
LLPLRQVKSLQQACKLDYPDPLHKMRIKIHQIVAHFN